MTSGEFWDIFEAKIRAANPEWISLLPKGADEKAIDAAERKMGVELPGPVRELYRRHDGSGRCCFGPWINGGGQQSFMQLDDVVRTWEQMCEIGADFEANDPVYGFGVQEGPIKANWWNRRWIPITENGCGDNILLDFDPDVGGAIGQVVDWWHEGAQSKIVAPGLLPWLQQIASALENGTMHVEA